MARQVTAYTVKGHNAALIVVELTGGLEAHLEMTSDGGVVGTWKAVQFGGGQVRRPSDMKPVSEPLWLSRAVIDEFFPLALESLASDRRRAVLAVCLGIIWGRRYEPQTPSGMFWQTVRVVGGHSDWDANKAAVSWADLAAVYDANGGSRFEVQLRALHQVGPKRAAVFMEVWPELSGLMLQRYRS